MDRDDEKLYVCVDTGDTFTAQHTTRFSSRPLEAAHFFKS